MNLLQRWWWRLVRLGFRLLYNEMAWTYDLVSWLASLGEWRAWQGSALPYVQGERVLEIAHGPGHMLLALRRAGYAATGLDLSPAMGRIARRRLQASGLPTPLVRGRAQALPFAARTFDTLLATFPTAFIAEPATMTEARRVLRPGGRLLIVPEGHLTGRGLRQRFVNWLYVITGQRAETFAVNEQTHSWPAPSPQWDYFRRQMTAAGFTVELKHIQLEKSAVTVLIASRD